MALCSTFAVCVSYTLYTWVVNPITLSFEIRDAFWERFVRINRIYDARYGALMEHWSMDQRLYPKTPRHLNLLRYSPRFVEKILRSPHHSTQSNKALKEFALYRSPPFWTIRSYICLHYRLQLFSRGLSYFSEPMIYDPKKGQKLHLEFRTISLVQSDGVLK